MTISRPPERASPISSKAVGETRHGGQRIRLVGDARRHLSHRHQLRRLQSDLGEVLGSQARSPACPTRKWRASIVRGRARLAASTAATMPYAFQMEVILRKGCGLRNSTIPRRCRLVQSNT
jgi:hypothetical protein